MQCVAFRLSQHSTAYQSGINGYIFHTLIIVPYGPCQHYTGPCEARQALLFICKVLNCYDCLNEREQYHHS